MVQSTKSVVTMNDLKKFSLTLFIICLVAAFLLALAYTAAKPKIDEQKKSEEQESLKKVLPDAKSFNPVTEGDETIYWEAINSQGKIYAYAFKAYGKGYSSTIVTMVGMLAEGTIVDINIMDQNETPGLGTRICEAEQKTTLWDRLRGKITPPGKPAFEAQFNNKNISGLDKLDTISGSTISSDAVIDSVKEQAQEILKMVNKNGK